MKRNSGPDHGILCVCVCVLYVNICKLYVKKDVAMIMVFYCESMCVRACVLDVKMCKLYVKKNVTLSTATCKIIETGATVFNSFLVVNWY